MRTKNLNSLGTEYNVIGPEGTLLRKVKILQECDILRHARGKFEDTECQTYEEYLMESNERLSGFVKDPLSVYWHTTTEENYDLMEIIDKCLAYNYEYVIIELINLHELDNDVY